MCQIELYIPQKEDLWYRQRMLGGLACILYP